MHAKIHIDYSSFKKPQYLFAFTFLGLLVYYLVGFGFNAEAFRLDSITVFELLSYLLIDQYLIGCISMAILFGSIILYTRIFKLNTFLYSVKGLVLYFGKFIPLVLFVFFVINPISQTLRFLWRYAGAYDWSIYWEYYFFQPQLYLTYTGILLPLIFLSLGINLIIQIRNYAEYASEKTEPKWKNIKVLVEGYENYLSSEKALWFEVDNRHYFMITSEGKYRISQTLSDLEEQLNERLFFRINRFTIINLAYVHSFSHWQNGKYIVKMEGANRPEHTIPRSRVADFKEKMASLN